MHWQRILRSMMHGFVAHEEAGGFSHFPIDKTRVIGWQFNVLRMACKNAGKKQNEHR
jgi:hypothetical protein